MAIIAIVLGGFGVACLIIVPKVLMGSVDRDLEVSAGITTKEVSQSFGKPQVSIDKIGTPLGNPKSVLGLPPTVVEGRDISSMIVNVDPSELKQPTKGTTLEDKVLLQDGVMQALKRDERIFTEVKHNGKRFRALASSVNGPDANKLMIVSAYSVEELYNLESALQRLFLILLPIALGATFIGGLAMTRKVLRPVREITEAASEVDAQDLSRRLEVSGNDEFAELAGTFNGMFDRLQRSFGDLQDSVEQQRRFVADASHELRTPLTVIRGSASWALQQGRTKAEIQEALEDTNRASTRMEHLIGNLLLLARSDGKKLNINKTELLISDLCQEAARQGVDKSDLPRIEIEVLPPNLTVLVDREKMLQVLGNLVDNAVRHTPSSGLVRLVARSNAGSVEIKVCDTGSGIPEEHLSNLFDRFYRVDDARSAEAGGTGLGLAICEELVQSHGGTISIKSQEGVGTTVTVSLPQAG